MILSSLMTLIIFGETFSLVNISISQAFPIKAPLVSDSLGVNIHFTDPQPGEMKQLANSGVKWVRMDMLWDYTEKRKGVYDFSSYDRLLATMKAHQIKLLLILGYHNPLYDSGLSPYTDSGRQAFGRWVSAAVKHFQGNSIIWEMYNEPNLGWRPKPNVDHYILLANVVGQAIRNISPNEVYIGPATYRVDLPFLEACFKRGLLKQWSAVSVHPYKPKNPETVVPDYRSLRALIKKYAPKNKQIPIISGEWGYPANEVGIDLQGKYLARQWLINLANEIPLSIWYDWRDDGVDLNNREHHAGLIHHVRNTSGVIAYKEKPAYLAARSLITILKDFRFKKRLNINQSGDYILLFSKGRELRFVAWTTASTQHYIKIPVNGTFKVINHTGTLESIIQSKSKNISVVVTDAPKYIIKNS
jgi:polysaccharide biosynthesis protein PslG